VDADLGSAVNLAIARNGLGLDIIAGVTDRTGAIIQPRWEPYRLG